MPDFLEYVFSTIPADVKDYSREVADYSGDIVKSVERHIEAVAASLRESLQHTPWIPDSLKPPPPPPLTRSKLPQDPLSYIERVRSWVSRNRAISAVILGLVSTGTLIIWRRRRYQRRKRRAPRAANGARTEVVILAGPPHALLTRSLALDLERRGFIVYIPVSTLAEERMVRAELRADIHPLNLDTNSPDSTAETLTKFRSQFARPHFRPLHLAALLLIPWHPSALPIGSITSIAPSTWSETLNTHVLSPISTAHTLLPLLLEQVDSLQNPSPGCTSVILLQPSITACLQPPHHAPESLAASALDAWLQTLRSELAGTGVAVTHIKLGAFDFGTAIGAKQQLTLLSERRKFDEGSVLPDDPNPAPSWLRSFAGNYAKRGTKSSSLRELHDGVFDTVVGRISSGTIFLGRGSLTYDVVGRWVPKGLIGWMMGYGAGMGAQEQRMEDDEEPILGAGSVEWENLENTC